MAFLRKRGRIQRIIFLFVFSAWSSSWAVLLPAVVQAAATTDNLPHSTAKMAGACQIRYAKGFSLICHDGYKIVTVFDPAHPEEKPLRRFVLVPRGAKVPVGVHGTVVKVPVKRLVLNSTVYSHFFSMLGLTDDIVGITQGDLVTDPVLSKRIRQGDIAEVGVGSGMATQINIERLLSLHPDLVLSEWSPVPAFAGYARIEKTGLPVALATEYMEKTPLGRAEWIKFLAAFFNKEAVARQIFNGIAGRYQRLAEKTRTVALRPTVFCDIAWRGLWYVPGGASYMAKFLNDAGADYIWRKNTTPGTMPLAVETVVDRARKADFWLDTGACASLAQLRQTDARYQLFTAFRSGNVFNNDARLNTFGGNDYYQTGMARPDLVLADLISIFHPRLVPGHRRIWYRRLPAGIRGKR